MIKNSYFYIVTFFIIVVIAYFLAMKYVQSNNIIRIQDHDNVKNIELKMDFGKIGNDKVIEKTIQIKNELNKEVGIQPKTNTCGCARLIMNATSIPANSDYNLKVVYDPTKRKPGPSRQKIVAKLINGDINLIEITVYAYVKKVLSYDTVIIFPKNSKESYEKKVVVNYNKNEPFVIDTINIPRGYSINLKKGDIIKNESIIYIQKFKGIESEIGKLTINSNKNQIIDINLVDTPETFFKVNPKIMHLSFTTLTEFVFQKSLKIVPMRNDIDTENINITFDNPGIVMKDQEVISHSMVNNVIIAYFQIDPKHFDKSYQGHFTIESDGYTQNVPVYITVYDWDD